MRIVIVAIMGVVLAGCATARSPLTDEEAMRYFAEGVSCGSEVSVRMVNAGMTNLVADIVLYNALEEYSGRHKGD